ncbi:sulfatase [Spirosoma aerophilum]
MVRLLILLGLAACGQFVMAQRRPNIIIFLVDDMGWQDTSVPFWQEKTAINRRFHTPNMERLARKGMKFTNAYANPVCTPSRVSLMTGMNVVRHNVTNWTNTQKNTPTDYPDSLLSPPGWNHNGMSPVAGIANTVHATPLPQLLRQAGYVTLHCGKAHFASYGTPAANPLAIGFEKNIAGTAAGHPSSFLGEKSFRRTPNDTTWGVRDLEKYHGKNIFLTEALTLGAIAALKENQPSQKPFFLYMSHYAVHLPFDKDARFYQKYLDMGLTDTEARYSALVEGMDKSLGDIMDYLEANNLDKNTYILFISDNGGYSLHQRSGEVHTQNLPLKQGKGSLYEGGIRVPMLVSGPKIEPNSLSRQYVGIDDFFPTVLGMAGVARYTTLQTVDGKNLLPFMENKDKRDDKKILLWHYPNNWTNVQFKGTSWGSAMRRGDWKLVYLHKTQTVELYNLKDDIGELNDLAKTQPAKLKQMARLFTDELKKRNAHLPAFKATGQPIPYPDEVK